MSTLTLYQKILYLIVTAILLLFTAWYFPTYLTFLVIVTIGCGLFPLMAYIILKDESGEQPEVK